MKTRPRFLSLLLFSCCPIFAQAHGFHLSDQDIAILLGILLAIFLAGYLPYIFLSLRLVRQANTSEGASTATKVGATIFMLINTGVFIYIFLGSISVSMADIGAGLFFFPLAIISLLFWGIPFWYYMKGIRAKGLDKSDILD